MSAAAGAPWRFAETTLPNGRGLHATASESGDPLRWSEALSLLAADADFRAALAQRLADAPFIAFRWETPALSTATIDRPFEYVLLDDPALARRTASQAFAAHFDGDRGDALVAEIPNLTGTSRLIVPRGIADDAAYPHLAAFLRSAPPAQVDALWRCTGEAVLRCLSPKPLWLSTAGAGVPWLHVRIDPTPKYYGHRPYATPA
ncbi:MAG: DUF6940 family protein [Lysobacteraceae bacterium]